MLWLRILVSVVFCHQIYAKNHEDNNWRHSRGRAVGTLNSLKNIQRRDEEEVQSRLKQTLNRMHSERIRRNSAEDRLSRQVIKGSCKEALIFLQPKRSKARQCTCKLEKEAREEICQLQSQLDKIQFEFEMSVFDNMETLEACIKEKSVPCFEDLMRKAENQKNEHQRFIHAIRDRRASLEEKIYQEGDHCIKGFKESVDSAKNECKRHGSQGSNSYAPEPTSPSTDHRLSSPPPDYSTYRPPSSSPEYNRPEYTPTPYYTTESNDTFEPMEEHNSGYGSTTDYFIA